MDSFVSYLKTQFSVSPSTLEKIKTCFKTEVLKKGDFFVKQGRLANKLGFIDSGLIRIYAESEEKEVTQWISTPGYFITELASFVFEKPARLHLQAIEDTVLFTIDKQTHRELCTSHADWNELDKKFIAKCFVMLEDRIFSHLYMTAEDRFKLLMETQPELFNRVPLQYLASMLGMTPETLSRLRKKI